jgi:hypothetical protein
MMTVGWFGGVRGQFLGAVRNEWLDQNLSSEFAPYTSDGCRGMLHRHGRDIVHTHGDKVVKVFRCDSEDDAHMMIEIAWEWRKLSRGV